MPFELPRPDAHASPGRLAALGPASRPPGELAARGFSLGPLSVAIVAALVLGGALSLFALGALRATAEALRAAALAAGLREGLDAAVQASRRGEPLCAPADAGGRCAMAIARPGLRVEVAPGEAGEGLRRIVLRVGQGDREARVELAMARLEPAP
ncbi:MAG: hypothetical protein RML12_03050 [Xanthomonadales bacterium]|nr:hypothetical protein [Xanthomonadales bacterium]